MSEYFERLRETLDGVVEHLTAKGIQPRHLAFGGEGEVPARKPTVPTDARSEFLANRAMAIGRSRHWPLLCTRRCRNGKPRNTATRIALRRDIPISERPISLASKTLVATESVPICFCFRHLSP